MAEISLEDVTKVYADGTEAVSRLNLDVRDGEFVVLVGPSGCGKTSALRMVAGLEELSAGTIRIGGRVVNDLLPKERDIAMVFQNYALYPHMNVYDNMAFGLKHQGVPKPEIERRVLEAGRTLGLAEVMKKRPRQLSGGQRQRVAMGRAIVREPQAFLMDEPLSNLDAKLRVEMRAEIQSLQRQLEVTTIYVTHDQTEAMTMGDRVAVMRNGVLQQVAHPQELYERPANLFVAEFIGSPAMNLVEATLARVDGGRLVARFGEHELVVPRADLAGRTGSRVILGIRPEDLEDAFLAGGARAGATLSVVPAIREEMGSEVFVHFSLGVPRVDRAEVLEAVDPGEPAEARQGARSAIPFVGRLGRTTAAREGESIEVAVAIERLYFFDPETGAGLHAER